MKGDAAYVACDSEGVGYDVVDYQDHQTGVKYKRQAPALAPIYLINAEKRGQAGRYKQQSVANNEAKLLLKGICHPISHAKRHTAGNGADVGDEVLPELRADKEDERRRHYQKGTHIICGASRAKGLAPILRIDVYLKQMLKKIKDRQRKYDYFLHVSAFVAKQKPKSDQNSGRNYHI